MIKKVREEEVKPVVSEVVVSNADLELYGKLRNEISAGRDNFKTQLQQVREAITGRTQEIETLRIKELKLQGAIEAAEIFLKAVLPSNNP